MKTKILFSVVLLAWTVPQWIDGAEAVHVPVLEKVIIPPYPFLARLTGTEGTVQVNLTLDTQCNITNISIVNGSPRLVDAVTRAVYGGGMHLLFRPCASARSTNVHLGFIFALRGQPTNGWSPTYVHVSSAQDLSFNIEITTTPPDLEVLGFEKKSAHGQEHGVEPAAQGKQDMPRTDFVLPSYPPLARTSRVQGEVKVAVELDSKCQVSTTRIVAGHPLLNSAVLDAVRDWHFPSCPGAGGQIDVTFHFALAEADDAARDDWSPTHIEMTGSYEFQVKTVAPDAIIYN